MASKTYRLLLPVSLLLLTTLTLAQNVSSSSTEPQNMPAMQMDGDAMKAKMKGPPMKLSDLEQMALSRNPTIAQANANLRAAEGAKIQAGLYPNPTVGYYGDEVRGGSFRSGKQGAYINQAIVLGGKLGAARRTAEQDRLLALTGIDSQRYRVLTDVRMLYYEALASARLVSIRKQLLDLAIDAVQTSHQLGNVGQADRPDILQAEVEGDQAGLDLEAAQQNEQAVWRRLAAVVGNSSLHMGPLEGNLEDIPQLDEQEWMNKILNESPPVKAAQQDAERAKAALVNAKKLPIPDLQISANLSQDNEPLEPSNRRVGIVGGAQIGVQLPIFNRNQGNVQRAKADAERGQEEVLRVQLELSSQMSTIFRDYQSARQSAERYRTRMLPRAKQACDLYKTNYENMAAAYPQVLISQRTLFQLQVDYIRALENVWINAAAIQGFTLSDGLAAPGPPAAGNRLETPFQMEGRNR